MISIGISLKEQMIGIGSDHGGYDCKKVVIQYLEKKGIAYKDYGCYDKSSCDYPVFGKAVAEAVASGECEKGIVICTSGIGISIVANKVKGVRAALCSEPLSAKMTRLHNDANVLALAGAYIGASMAEEIVEVFLNTDFSAEDKHIRRIDLMEI